MKKFIILWFVLFTGNLFAQERIVTAKGICSVNEECIELTNLIPESRIIINSPKKELINPKLPTRVVLFALPNGNTIEKTAGKLMDQAQLQFYTFMAQTAQQVIQIQR